MHFVFLIPIGGAGLWFLFFVLLAEAAPAFVGTVALIVFLAFVAWIITALQLWSGVGALLAVFVAILAFILALNWLSNSWWKMLRHPSKEAYLAAIALANLKRTEARADRAAIKAQTAKQRAARTNNPLVKFIASYTEDTALELEQLVLEKMKFWEQAEAQAYRIAEVAAQKIRAQADAAAVRQREFDLARKKIEARAERAKGHLRTGRWSAHARREPPVKRPRI